MAVSRGVDERQSGRAASLRRQQVFERYGLTLLLGIGAVVMLGPFLWMVLTSLKQEQEVLRLPITWLPDHLFYFDNYTSIADQLPIGRFFLNSLIVTGLAMVPSLFFSSLAGYAFAKLDFPYKNVCFILVIAVMMVPIEVKLIPLYIMFSKAHLLNTYIGIAAPSMISPLAVFFMRQFMQTIPNDYLDAARVDGAGEFKVFWRIAVPLMKPALLTLAIILFIFDWNSFLWPLVMAQDESRMTITVGLALLGNEFYIDYTKLTAGATMTVLPILILFFIFQRRVMQGFVASGLKA